MNTGMAALVVAVVALALAAFAVGHIYRIAAAVRSLAGLVATPPSPSRSLALVAPPGTDAATAMQTALDNAPGLFEEARRARAICDTSAPPVAAGD